MGVKVRFVDSELEAEWSEGCLLEFAEEQGLMPNYGCRGGACGCCETRLVSGAVEYLEEPSFSPEEGSVLLCCSRPKEGLGLIELDL